MHQDDWRPLTQMPERKWVYSEQLPHLIKLRFVYTNGSRSGVSEAYVDGRSLADAMNNCDELKRAVNITHEPGCILKLEYDIQVLFPKVK